MSVTLDEAKLYLRVDSTVEDDLINNLIAASESYLKDAVTDYATNITDSGFAAKAKIAQLAIITEMYENRNSTQDGAKDYGYAIRTLITQMQYWSSS
ncbi:head-tail connector protein [Pectinatus haikarae]|uniref:Phage protein (Predicted DNA packaging) n=1 Tax=Pectinatus haikarae TaxID=349096 RepID=A0ABT9Y8W0_9FIRM|nr:head-tail connector protein [Pectinatus haikarae]MDQ0204073.1 putative phage protein (predicted DNA packaging) [Pectinatus haikarae]